MEFALPFATKPGSLPACLRDEPGGDRLQADRHAIQIRSLPALAQDQDPRICEAMTTGGVANDPPLAPRVKWLEDQRPRECEGRRMSDSARRNWRIAEKAGLLVALAVALLLTTAIVAITIRSADRHGVSVWQLQGL